MFNICHWKLTLNLIQSNKSYFHNGYFDLNEIKLVEKLVR